MREHTFKDITWISVLRPDSETLQELHHRFPTIHPLVMEELANASVRPRVENYDHHIFIVLHFPKLLGEIDQVVTHEIDFILTRDALISVQYRELPEFEEIWQGWEERGFVREQYSKTPIHLFCYILRHLFSASLRELDRLQRRIDDIESKIFSSEERETLQEISLLKKDTLDFRRAIKLQHLTLESLVLQGTELYGAKVKPLLNDLLGEYLKVWNLLENHKETVDGFYETKRTLLAYRNNQIMKIFTVLAFITFLPSAIVYLSEARVFFLTILALLILYMILKHRKHI